MLQAGNLRRPDNLLKPEAILQYSEKSKMELFVSNEIE
jgi:hypothetical protein